MKFTFAFEGEIREISALKELVSHDPPPNDRASWVIPVLGAALPYIVSEVGKAFSPKPPAFEGIPGVPPQPKPESEPEPDLSENPNPDNLEPPA